MAVITITDRKINNTTTQFILTDTTHNIIMEFECSIENINEYRADAWVQVTENINSITTNITHFFIDDGIRLYEIVRDFVEYALNKNVKAVNFDSIVNRVALTYVTHIIEVTETMMLRG